MKILQKITEALYSWKDPFTGENVVRKVYRREDIYRGSCLDRAPDLIIDYNEPFSFSYLSRPSYTRKNGAIISKLSKKEIDSARFQSKSGSHRNLGIFVAYGDGIKSGNTTTGVHIVDIAPTVLHILGLAIPSEMDGKVIEECFEESHAQKQILKKETEEKALFTEQLETEQTYTAGEEEEIRKRLKSMGYID